jgi:hypothetical protein
VPLVVVPDDVDGETVSSCAAASSGALGPCAGSAVADGCGSTASAEAWAAVPSRINQPAAVSRRSRSRRRVRRRTSTGRAHSGIAAPPLSVGRGAIAVPAGHRDPRVDDDRARVVPFSHRRGCF